MQHGSLVLLSGFCFFAASCGVRSAQSSSDSECTGTAGSLSSGLFSLNGSDPTLNSDDLSPLAQLTDGADYIGLGESVHTSGGYYQMKERVIRYLVEHGGVRALAMETPHTRAEVAADFIRTCQGDVLDALRGVFPVFADDHLRDLFLWLCQFNQRNPTDPVVFFGFDEQQPVEDYAAISNFVN